jgi:histidine ammonia-lyase
MVAQLGGFGRGRSGVRPVLADHLVEALNAGLAPRVHSTGSLGQSDLGPLAELACALTGENGSIAELDRLGLKPWRPAAKEGLAFINSNAFTLGWTALALADAERLLDLLDLSAAMTFEGMLGNVQALDAAWPRLGPCPAARGPSRGSASSSTAGP